MTFTLAVGDRVNERQMLADLVAQQYRRKRQRLRARDLPPPRRHHRDLPAHYEDRAWRVLMFGDEVEAIQEFDPLTGRKTADLPSIKIYANSHYVTPRPTLQAGDHRHPRGAAPAPRLAGRQRQAPGGAAAGAAHPLRPGDDRDHRIVRRHRELLPLPHRPPPRRAAADLLRIHPRQRPPVRRREPPDRPPDRGVCTKATATASSPWPSTASGCPAPGQPPPDVRGVGGDAAPDRARLGHPRPVGDGAHRRRLQPSR